MPKGRASRGRPPVEAQAYTHDDATRVHIPESGNVDYVPKAKARQKIVARQGSLLEFGAV